MSRTCAPRKSPPPPVSISWAIIWLSVAVCKSMPCLAITQRWTTSTGATSQASRRPGASVLEKVLR